MLTVLIYEPDRQHAQQLRDKVKKFFLSRRCEIRLATYTLAEPVLSRLQDNPHQYNILLLNAANPALTCKMASLVRKENLQSNILFHASDYKPLLTIPAYRPSAFLTLPVREERLRAALILSQKEQERSDGYFLVSGRTGYIRKPYESIEYFRSDQHSVYMFVRGRQEKYSFNDRLDVISLRLPSNLFLRCPQSYCINTRHIAGVDRSRKSVMLFSGACIPISKSNYNNLIAACRELMKDENGV